jgi:hypothetical protein
VSIILPVDVTLEMCWRQYGNVLLTLIRSCFEKLSSAEH